MLYFDSLDNKIYCVRFVVSGGERLEVCGSGAGQNLSVGLLYCFCTGYHLHFYSCFKNVQCFVSIKTIRHKTISLSKFLFETLIWSFTLACLKNKMLFKIHNKNLKKNIVMVITLVW